MKNIETVGVIKNIDKCGRLSLGREFLDTIGVEYGDFIEQRLCKTEDGEMFIMIRRIKDFGVKKH